MGGIIDDGNPVSHAYLFEGLDIAGLPGEMDGNDGLGPARDFLFTAFGSRHIVTGSMSANTTFAAGGRAGGRADTSSRER